MHMRERERQIEDRTRLDMVERIVAARDLAAGTRLLGKGLWKGGDQAMIDGAIVNGSWKLVGWVSGLVRWAQSGYLYHYAFVMIVGVFVLMTYFVWFNK